METINVIYVEPGKEARTIEMKDELSEMQNLVGTTLNGEMDMMTEVGCRGYGMKNVFCHIFGV